ncbi:MAG: Panacea domain-containing protein [candidate division KSB1 bacterium]
MKKTFDRERFKETILYIAERCQDKPAFGSTHLNKILHYSDFLFYAETGEPISGETYLRQKHGQIPKHLVEVREELINEGKLIMVERQYFGRTQKRPVLASPIHYELLTPEQREFINGIIVALIDYNAAEVSEQIAHEDLSWAYLENDEEIPYETVFFRRSNPITHETMAWAKSVINEYEDDLHGEKDDSPNANMVDVLVNEHEKPLSGETSAVQNC